MMNPNRETLRAAIEKADAPYGTVRRDLRGAIETLRKRRGRLETCMESLKMTTVPKAVVLQRLVSLERASRS